mmetsp:Transcript_18835/g.34955  ORF Transcript_18835/g.34955 Transcript_18835/m.34955 type:complete len:678 (-) Transcript_18835:827-2860(-)
MTMVLRPPSGASAVLGALLLGGRQATAFYLPGVNPQSFAEGDPVKLKVNKMTSQKTLMPVDYYRLPFCQPEGGPKMDNENLGEFLSGDRIESTPYRLQMKTEMFCEQVCITNLGRAEQKGVSPNKVVRAIRKNYHNNWIVDNLSSASKMEDDKTITTRYWQGFPVGFVATDTHKAYVYNHVNLEIQYHKVETEVDKYRIVRFTVEPFSIKHDFEPAEDDDDDDKTADDDAEPRFRVADIQNPIRSCDRHASEKKHTTYDMVYGRSREPQIASGKVLFTYDVTWKENKELHWASRWDVYLSMDDAIPAKVHWLSIANSLVIVFVLTAMIAAILVRNLRRDYARYNKLATDEEKAEDLEEFGWKLVHADVFRPPTTRPMLFCVFVGSGAQLCTSAFFAIALSAVGFLSPARRGSLMIAVLVLYMLCGALAGYVSSRLYKSFRGRAWQMCTLFTATLFPGTVVGVFLFFNIILAFFHSSGSVPFVDVIIVLAMWCCVSIPLVFLGAYFGYKADAISYPTVTSTIARAIPEPTLMLNPYLAMALAGMVPFAAAYVELFFIMTSLWMDQFYYVFGFTLIVYLILLITCAEVTVLLCYYQLCGENHRWWWFSFFTAGSTAFYMFVYSAFWFKSLEASKMMITYMLYFGYMFLISYAMFLVTGMVGAMSCLWFTRKIFGSIKVD